MRSRTQLRWIRHENVYFGSSPQISLFTYFSKVQDIYCDGNWRLRMQLSLELGNFNMLILHGHRTEAHLKKLT